MEARKDFLNTLDSDASIMILMCLDHISDLVRASSVSCSWRHFVIAKGLCKRLCLRMLPQLSNVDHVLEVSKIINNPSIEVDAGNSGEWKILEKEHRVYTSLAWALSSFPSYNCISHGLSASTTDNYPEESIVNTLDPRNRIGRRGSYWSSEGTSDPSVPEKLTYKLMGDSCVISEIHIEPFQAYFQSGSPIYSAKAVRFRMGHPNLSVDSGSELEFFCPFRQDSTDDKFIWTYTSQAFPMAQESCLQKFKLPEPVLCIGGILQIELLGRVQTQEMDGLYYICVAHVKVMGRSLMPTFQFEVLEPSDRLTLKYYPDSCEIQQGLAEQEDGAADRSLGQPLSRLSEEQLRLLEQIMGDGYYHVLELDEDFYESEDE